MKEGNQTNKTKKQTKLSNQIKPTHTKTPHSVAALKRTRTRPTTQRTQCQAENVGCSGFVAIDALVVRLVAPVTETASLLCVGARPLCVTSVALLRRHVLREREKI